ncbi:hypothetical protein [Alistipes sp.]|uniref:hypothetical protein n=1 Tax=Alistipes sp. TaxID=1872444 RepID=UPI003AB80B0A
MKSTRAKAYINDSLTLELYGGFGITQQDAIRAVEIAENDMLVTQYDQHQKDLQFLQDMLDKFDTQQMDYVRQNIVDWRDELEGKIAKVKREINA